MEIEDIVKPLFANGYSHKEIKTALLFKHNIIVSLCHLKRILKKLNLRRRNFDTPIPEVVNCIEKEVSSNFGNLGQNSMWTRLKVLHGLRVRRNDVRLIMRVLDPQGTELRKANRLVRRQYKCPGPNFVWHIDGFDKLKPFGFCIHGAIDGYSRKIIWLKVGLSNNNPKVVATYFLDTIGELGFVPFRIRSDMGTENVMVRELQIYFRSLANNDESDIDTCSFIQGKSTSNQRIEALWCIFRRMVANSFMNIFKDLQNSNIYDDQNPFHIECLKFCFMELIEAKIKEFVNYWNLHKLRSDRTTEMPNEKPKLLYECSELYGGRDMKQEIKVMEDVEICKELYNYPSHKRGCSEEFLSLVSLLDEHAINVNPKTVESAIDLFGHILDLINEHNP